MNKQLRICRSCLRRTVSLKSYTIRARESSNSHYRISLVHTLYAIDAERENKELRDDVARLERAVEKDMDK